MTVHVVYRDSGYCDRLALLPDPLTGQPAALDPDTALGIARLLASHGVQEVGIVTTLDAPPGLAA